MLWLLTFYSPLYAFPILSHEELSGGTFFIIESGTSELNFLDEKFTSIELAVFPNSPAIFYRTLLPEHKTESTHKRDMALMSAIGSALPKSTEFFVIGLVIFDDPLEAEETALKIKTGVSEI